ncbi:MAG: KAP family P-loop NTPase fold protein [Ignavibacteriaceae bacterium]
MKRKFIIDEEINLNELDLLNTKKYATSIRKIILNSPINKVFTIGLFGGWGSGKSSIIKTVQSDLEKNTTQKIKFINYDAWKYANDSFRRMLLLQIQAELKFKQTELMEKFYAHENRETKISAKFNVTNFIITCLIVAIGLLVVLIANFNQKISIITAIIVPFLSILSNIFFKVFDQLKISIQKPYYFAPEQFEDCFKQIVSKSLKQYTWVEKTGLYISGEHFVKDIDKLVIVIDNIDRCHKELAYSLLTDIKTFLGNENYNIVFVIPVDDEALKKHIINTTKPDNKSDGNIEAEEFLRKFFNITVRLKQFHSREIIDLTESLNKKYDLNFNATTVNLISKEFAKNPRRIIQFFNNLSSELNNYEENFSEINESIICKFQIIKEEFPDYYNLISRNPYFINNPSDKLIKEIEDNPALRSFLEQTRALTHNTSFIVFDSILSNSKGLSILPQEVIEIIDDLNYEALNEYVSSNKDQLHAILKDIINNLKSAVLRQLWDTDFINNFELLTSINSKNKIEFADNLNIHGIIQNHFDIIIDNSSNINNILVYANDLFGQSIPSLKENLIEHISDKIIKDSKVDPYYKNIFILMLNEFTDASDLSKFPKPFWEVFKLDTSILKVNELTNVQAKYLITDSFIEYCITKIEVISEEDYYYDILKDLLKLKRLSNNLANFLFEKVNQKLPDFRGYSKDDIIKILIEVDELLSLIMNDLRHDTDKLQALLDKFSNGWRIPHAHPNYANNPANDTIKNLITESLNSPEDINELMNFYSNLYRITIGNISVLSSVNNILSNSANRSIVNEYLIKLKQEFALTSFYDIILGDRTYSPHTLQLFDFIFTKKSDKKEYLLSDVKLSNKISELLDYSITEDPEVQKFLVRLSNRDERVRKVMISLICAKDKDYILKLSTELQAFAIDSIKDGEVIFDYENNIGFLKVIATKGSNIHLRQLTRVLVRKIDKEVTLLDAVSIIKELKSIPNKESIKLLFSLESLSENEIHRPEIEESISHIKNITEK